MECLYRIPDTESEEQSAEQEKPSSEEADKVVEEQPQKKGLWGGFRNYLSYYTGTSKPEEEDEISSSSEQEDEDSESSVDFSEFEDVKELVEENAVEEDYEISYEDMEDIKDINYTEEKFDETEDIVFSTYKIIFSDGNITLSDETSDLVGIKFSDVECTFIPVKTGSNGYNFYVIFILENLQLRYL